MTVWTRRAWTRSLIACAVITLAGCPSSEPTGRVDPVQVSCAARVYLLRGLADVFSLGLDELAEKLRAIGVDARSISGPSWPELLTILDSPAHSPDEPIILMGHSYGADDALNLCKQLQARGIDVDLVFLIDATDPRPVPANVARCVHIYIPTEIGAALPSVFAGNPIVAEDGNDRTVIENRQMTVDEFGPAARSVDHFTLDSSPLMHDAAIAEVRRICPDEPLHSSAVEPANSVAP